MTDITTQNKAAIDPEWKIIERLEREARMADTQAGIERNRAMVQQYYVENIINLVHNGFTPQSAIDAVVSNDLTKLETKSAPQLRVTTAKENA